MSFFILVLLICLLIFLFSLYFLSHDDLIFLRKDISIEKIFNIAFMDFLVGLFFSRLFYGVFYKSSILLHPFIFILFPYFPGLSLTGGILGAAIFLYIYSKKKTIPISRIFDFLSISFLSALPIGILGYFFLSGPKLSLQFILLFILSIVIFFAFIKYFRNRLLKGKIKDGTTGFIFILVFSLLFFLFNVSNQFKGLGFLNQPENYLLLIMSVISVGLIIDQEKLI